MNIDTTQLDPSILYRDRGRVLHLDSSYRAHYCLFQLNDGRVEDSRRSNWRHIDWERLDRIFVNIKGKEHRIEKHPRDHKFFMYYRTEGFEHTYLEGDHQANVIRYWTLGTTDGNQCFLVDVDFHTGELKKAYIRPLTGVIAHIHPRIQAIDKVFKLYSGGRH